MRRWLATIGYARAAMRATEIIDRKRLGEALTDGEIDFLISGYVGGTIPDYQMSAFTMAVCCRGMDGRETATLTRAMIASGDTIELSGIGRPTVDKHSTGGVGDKTTLVVAPLAASLGVAVPKLSGRGLGHTGGTIDKLESIPGFRTDLGIDELVAIARETGVAVASPTGDIVPADRKLYALRDATATVQSMPLIASSIMSKKLAVATDAIVLDVKVGEGAFFPTIEIAREFAALAIAIGSSFGRRVRCVLTSMDRPLGRAVGNTLEVAEAIATLRGNGPQDLVSLCIEVATQMVLATDPLANATTVRKRITEQLASGGAFTVFDHWIGRQGGDLEPLVTGRQPQAGRQLDVVALGDGHISRIHALAIGRLAMALGAGRETKEDSVDHTAGIVLDVALGDHVTAGQRLGVLHTNRSGDELQWQQALVSAIELSASSVAVHDPVLEVIGGEPVTAG